MVVFDTLGDGIILSKSIVDSIPQNIYSIVGYISYLSLDVPFWKIPF